jgi:hypothetical protein
MGLEMGGTAQATDEDQVGLEEAHLSLTHCLWSTPTCSILSRQRLVDVLLDVG